MPTSGLWTPHWPPNELGDEEDLRLERERAQRVADARADTTARARASPTRALSPTKPKPPTPPLFEEDPLPLASHDPDNPSHEGLVAVATRTARRWSAAQRPGGAATSWASRATSSRATSVTWRRRIRRSYRNPCGRCATSRAAARSPATTSTAVADARGDVGAARHGAAGDDVWHGRRYNALCVNSPLSVFGAAELAA